VLKQFMEVAMAEQDEVHDIFIMPSCRSKASKSAFQKILGKLIVQDDLHITYKECSKRGARNSVEIVYAASSKKFPVHREGPRKIFTSTTLASNCLVQVDDFSSVHGSQPAANVTVSRSDKERIIGQDGLTIKEKALAPTGTVFLYHWEKTEATWMEIFHHYGLTSMATVSAGRWL